MTLRFQKQASVLVVDDESNIRLMLQTILESEGYGVTTAGNGREALEQIRNGSFDVVLLDLNMPVLDGMSVLEQLQTKPPKLLPRVIVLTAYGSIPVAVRAIRSGAVDFLEKPATPEEVRDSVAAVLRDPPVMRTEPGEAVGESGSTASLQQVRHLLRAGDLAGAESLLIRLDDLAQHDPAYFNLLGVMYEMRKQWRLAKKFYGKAIAVDRNNEAAQQNMRRIYELYTFGKSQEDVALGDEPPAGALDELLRTRLGKSVEHGGHHAND